ncbi:MAG: VTT domain-containing protein [Patescibacteria group bacterium]
MNIKQILKTTLLVIFSIVFIFLTFKYAQADEVRRAINAFGTYGVIAFILAKTASRIVVPVSGTPLYVLAALIYGPFYGSLISFIGDMLAAYISFVLARVYGRALISRFISKNESDLIPKVLSTISTTRGLIVVHFIMIAFPDIINYTAGLGTVSVWTYLLVHAPFALISSFVVSYASEYAATFGSLGVVGFILFIIVLGGIGLLGLRKYSNKDGNTPK